MDLILRQRLTSEEAGRRKLACVALLPRITLGKSHREEIVSMGIASLQLKKQAQKEQQKKPTKQADESRLLSGWNRFL